MWPMSALRRNRYNRRYRAAWTLLLARYTFERLSSEQQAAVRERDIRYLLACGDAMALRRRKNPRYFPDYVIAMKSLGIAPALEGERWPIPDDVEMPAVIPNRWGMLPRARNKVFRYWLNLVTHYRTFDPATEAARLDLARRGIDIPTIDPGAVDDVHHFDSKGRPVTWRQWWLSKGIPAAAAPPTSGSDRPET